MDARQKLKQYAKKIGIEHITLDQLMDSHEYLRGLNLESTTERMRVEKEAYDKAYRDANEECIRFGWFSRERLLDMKLSELAYILAEEE